MRVSEFRIGNYVEYKGEICTVFEMEHRTPGKGRARYQVAFKSLETSRILRDSFRPDDELKEVRLNTHKAQFSYADGEGFHFMDSETFETIAISTDIVGEMKNYIKEGADVELLLNNDQPLSVKLPASVDLKVTDAPVGVKGDTASSTMKTITLETGYVVNAPLFIGEGEIVKIDTRTGKYLGRA